MTDPPLSGAHGRSIRFGESIERNDEMTVHYGLLALLEAQPGKGGELAAFLEAGRALAAAETETITWYAFKIADTTYGIFDTFATEDGRQAHLNGQIPIELGKVAADLLAKDPDIQPIDILAVK
jgi:hypothetical protein